MTDFPRHFYIGNRRVGPGEPTLIIAEAGVNHFGEISKAYDLVSLAAKSGADVLKIQHFKTDELVGAGAPEWRDRLRTKELGDDDIRAIRDRCVDLGIRFLCTAHHESVLDFLDKELDVAAFKVGSGELENWPFLADIARRGKPVILSTGMYRLDQIRDAIQVVKDNGCPPLAILHCVTSYPAEPSIINLRVMDEIRKFFPGPVGYSDHTAGTAVPLAAVVLGADIVEKHITIDKNIPNAQDWKVSCDPDSLPAFVKDVRAIELAVGDGCKNLSQEELQSINWARKSLTAATRIYAGDVITENMLVAQRPGTGIPPSMLRDIVGRVASQEVGQGEMINLAALR